MSLYLFMLARFSSGTGGNAPPAGAATAIFAVVVTSYLLWGQGLSPSVAVVCVFVECCGIGAHLDLSLPGSLLRYHVKFHRHSDCDGLCPRCFTFVPLVQLSLSCARSAVLFSSGNCLRLKALIQSTNCAVHCCHVHYGYC